MIPVRFHPSMFQVCTPPVRRYQFPLQNALDQSASFLEHWQDSRNPSNIYLYPQEMQIQPHRKYQRYTLEQPKDSSG